MRQPSLIAVLFVAIVTVNPAPAEDTLKDVLTEKTQPLIKALSLLGTPYKFGSSNPEKGLDCSGLVKHVYKESAGFSLPRSAREMSAQGEQIAESDLKPGDLVFSIPSGNRFPTSASTRATANSSMPAARATKQ